MMAMTSRNNTILNCLLSLLALISILTIGTPAFAAHTQKSFATPEDAVKKLISAVKESNDKELTAILGAGSQSLISSGDMVRDRTEKERFVKFYEEKNSIDQGTAGKAILSVGSEETPFPIPLVKKGDAWFFDTKAGKEEILDRRIGRNELEVIDILRAYVDAQHEYAAKARQSGSVLEFAQKIKSTPGKKDGLYWEAKEGEEESPFGPLAAKAAQEGYKKAKSVNPSPYYGYYFKILKAQGKHAEGGAFDYLVNGRMVLGFALVAYPVTYRSSGVMTFIVNQNGEVYQKDLGKNTARIASSMKRYDPDKSWKKVE